MASAASELCEKLNVEQSTLSQQLAVLRNRNIIVGRKEGLARRSIVRREIRKLYILDSSVVAP